MSEEQIQADIKKFIESNITAGGYEITAGTMLSDAGVDSYSIVEIILFIERKYGVAIPNEEMLPDNFSSIAAIAKTVMRFL